MIVALGISLVCIAYGHIGEAPFLGFGFSQ